jgi:hypothetical protein
MKGKLKEWIRRYGWAEVFSTILTYLFGWTAARFGQHAVVIAYAGTVGAAAGFYGFIFTRDILGSYRKHEPQSFRAGSLLVAKCLRNMGFEFGLAEVFDFFLIRPFFLFYGPLLLDHYFWGVLAGKTIADIIFFAISILMFEIRKKHFHWF